jgi:ABC-type spermidine/putrescine transport system permease subunit II
MQATQTSERFPWKRAIFARKSCDASLTAFELATHRQMQKYACVSIRIGIKVARVTLVVVWFTSLSHYRHDFERLTVFHGLY